MKKIFITTLSFFFLLTSFYSFAQVPQRFNYQGIARDAKGNPMVKQSLALKLTVLPASDATAPEYEETQHVITNEFGLYTLQIGNGTPVTGEMKAVKWETGNKYIKVAIDPKGGSDFVDAGTMQLLSVPYAIYADKAGIAKNTNGDRTGTVSSNATHVTSDTNFLTKFTGLNVIGKSQVFDNGTNLGIGTTSPLFKLHIQKSTGNADLLVRTLDPTAAASLRLRNSAGNELGINKFGPNATGTFMGIPRANMAAVNNFTTGPFVFNSGSDIVFGNTVGPTQVPRIFVSGATGNVGIGTLTPTSKLEVVGQVKITGGSPAEGKVLTSDSTGLASWQSPSNTTIENGLTKKNDTIRMGGRLNKSTIINQDGKIFSITDNDSSGLLGVSISQLVFSPFSSLSAIPVSQTFTSIASNKLHSIDLRVTALSNTSITLELKNGLGTTLASQTQNYATLFDSISTFTIASQPILLPNEIYTISVTGTAGTSWYFTNTNPYADGEASTGASNDFTFQVRTRVEQPVLTAKNERIGIGTDEPTAKLDINGNIRIQGGNPGMGKVLTSNATGFATWQLAGADSQWASNGSSIFNKNLTGSVGIGTSSPLAKLHLVGGNPSFQIEETGGSNSNIIFARAGDQKWFLLENFSTPSDNIAFYDNSTFKKHFQLNQGASAHIGIGPDVENTQILGACMVQIDGALSTEGALHIGPYTTGAAGYTSISRPTTSSTNGILRIRDGINTRALVDITSASFIFTVTGSALATGGTWTNSDLRLKKEILPISNALNDIKKLRPTQYYFKSDDEKYTYLNLPKSLQFGLIAQEVREVFPNIVIESRMTHEDGTEREESVLSMNYNELVPVLIKGMQEQQELIEKLEKRIAELEK